MKPLLAVCSLALFVLIASCKKDEITPKKSQAEIVTEKLTQGSGKWTPSATAGVTVDGLDVTEDLFKDFTITFTADKIFTSGTTPVWLREDTWQFKDETATILLRGQDDKEITVELADDILQLTLEWDQTTYAEGGKVKSIPGTFVFTLSK